MLQIRDLSHSWGNSMFPKLLSLVIAIVDSKFVGFWCGLSTLHFFSNFLLIFISVCGGHLSGDSGSFTSPEYPDKYPSDKKCVWIISVSRGKTIELSFEDFQTENDGSCKYDYVEVRNGLRIQDPLVGKYCGTANIPLIRSSGSSLFIKFTSDKSVSEKGFKASWKSNGPSTTPRETSTPTPKPTEAGE